MQAGFGDFNDDHIDVVLDFLKSNYNDVANKAQVLFYSYIMSYFHIVTFMLLHVSFYCSMCADVSSSVEATNL